MSSLPEPLSSRMADLVHSSIPTSHSAPCAPVHFARAGTSPAYVQPSSQASRGSTRVGLRSSSQDTLPSCAQSVNSTHNGGPSHLNVRCVLYAACGTDQRGSPHRTPTGIINRDVQCRVAHRVRPFCTRGQPRGVAQLAQISPHVDANAVA